MCEPWTSRCSTRKDRGTRDQIANMHWITEKAREFQKNIYFCFIDYAKAFDCVDHNKLLKIPQEMGIPDHLTCLLRNLYEGQEATVKTGHGTTDWFQIGKEVHQGCISPLVDKWLGWGKPNTKWTWNIMLWQKVTKYSKNEGPWQNNKVTSLKGLLLPNLEWSEHQYK